MTNRSQGFLRLAVEFAINCNTWADRRLTCANFGVSWFRSIGGPSTLFHFFSSQHKNITNVLNTPLDKLNAKDPETMQQLSDAAGTIDPAIIEMSPSTCRT
jgi:hypothetical protein